MVQQLVLGIAHMLKIIASWCGNNGIVNPGMMRPGIILYFIVHIVVIKGQQDIHVFAVCILIG